MTAPKSLPARPSLESLRKQAKKLARDIAAGDAGAIARARVHLPRVDPPLTQRNAQLVIAREYGYAGWQDLTAEVSKRLGTGLEWAAAQARRVIHGNDVERLKQLLAECPALLSWQGDDDHSGLLGFATGAYGDACDPDREQVVHPRRVRRAADRRRRGRDALGVSKASSSPAPGGCCSCFSGRACFPARSSSLAALGDLDAVRAALDENRYDLAAVNEAFDCACRFEHEAGASLLLERSIALDPELGGHVDGSLGRLAFVKYFIEKRPAHATAVGLWKAFVMEQVIARGPRWRSHGVRQRACSGSRGCSVMPLWSFRQGSSGPPR